MFAATIDRFVRLHTCAVDAGCRTSAAQAALRSISRDWRHIWQAASAQAAAQNVHPASDCSAAWARTQAEHRVHDVEEAVALNAFARARGVVGERLAAPRNSSVSPISAASVQQTGMQRTCTRCGKSMKHSVPCTHEPCTPEHTETSVNICQRYSNAPNSAEARSSRCVARPRRANCAPAMAAQREMRARAAAATRWGPAARRHISAPCPERRPACFCSPPWRHTRRARRKRCTCCARRQRPSAIGVLRNRSRASCGVRSCLRRRVPRRSAAPRSSAAPRAQGAVWSTCEPHRDRTTPAVRLAVHGTHQRFVPFGSAVMSSRPVFH